MILASNSLGVLTTIFLSLSLVCCSGKNSSSLKQTTENDTSKAGMRGTTKLLTYEERQGEQLYIKYCAVCHGEEGKGDGFNAFNLDPKPRDFTDSTYMIALSDSRLFETISEGGRGVNKSPLMPSWGVTLSKDNILSAISYVKTFTHRIKPGK